MDAETIIGIIKRRKDDLRDKQIADGEAAQLACDIADDYDSLLAEIEASHVREVNRLISPGHQEQPKESASAALIQYIAE